jgi:hypothetical protein
MFNPSRGEDINKLIAELYQIPAEIVGKASKLTGVASGAK